MKLPQKLKSITQTTMQTVRQPFRGVLSFTKSDQNYQSMQVKGLEGEVIPDAEFYQQFGLTSNPPADTKVIVLPLGGESSHSVIIATENGNIRVQNLKSGETCVYNESGAKITLKNDKIIDIEADELNIKVKRYTCNAEETITQESGAQTVMKSNGTMTLSDPATIILDTPSTMINGGLTAGGVSRNRAIIGNYTATFNLPVTFTRLAIFKVAFEAIDGIFSKISFLKHIHKDSIGGDTEKPKE